jgi:hypothetical protein
MRVCDSKLLIMTLDVIGHLLGHSLGHLCARLRVRMHLTYARDVHYRTFLPERF